MPPIEYDRAAEMTQYLQERLVEGLDADLDRRTVLKGLGGLAAGSAATMGTATASSTHGSGSESYGFDENGHFAEVGEYRDLDFNPHEFLSTFNTGKDGQESVQQEVYKEDGRTVRHFQFTAVDTTITIAPGVEFAAWAYNGQVPGPTIRAEEGDLIRITFNNLGAHDHTIHPHLKNLNPAMDGIPSNGPGTIDPTDDAFTYEWIAQPAGAHLYHCHSLPLKDHIHRGLYGVIIVDPDPERVAENPHDYVNYQGPIDAEYRDRLVAEAKSRNHEYPENDAVNEMVIVMNSFDTNFDGGNEVYAANTRAFAYGLAESDGEGNWSGGETIHPIRINKNERQRIYLVNTTEFDLINSFHTHSQFFDYYDHGTTLMPTHKTIDTIMQAQAQRGIIELDYADHQPGLYMFHAHISEFAELGWMSFFEVVDE
ncbi:MAG: multicopper oxidase domain-containing protein [Halobacteriales archaeon]